MRKTLHLVKESLEPLLEQHELLRTVVIEGGYWAGLSLKACWWLMAQVQGSSSFAEETQVHFGDPALAYFSVFAKAMGLLPLDIQVDWQKSDSLAHVDFSHF